ncbi:MAG: helix-turn-helix domain-containing protein [Candidatus Latescibacteria bacterium]|nr:helix-turn-helix domain-containing protein [Candidatus Latescibacterota bacterium]
MGRILIADSDHCFASALRDDLRNRAWEVEIVPEGGCAFARLCVEYFDVAILDCGGAGGRGLDVLRAVRERGIQVEVVMVSASAAMEEAVQALKAGAQEFLKKPVEVNHLSYLISRLLERRCGSPHYLANRLDLFIREHCSRRALRLGQLCEHFRISPRYVSRLLSLHLGISFRQRLRYYRVQVAKRLIETTSLPLHVIAAQCGFNSPGRLSEAFHQQEGLPPKRYRTLYKG